MRKRPEQQRRMQAFKRKPTPVKPAAPAHRDWKRLVLAAAGVLITIAMVWHYGAIATQPRAPAQPVLYTYRIVREYPHDVDAFTQGLQFERQCSSNDSAAQHCTQHRDVLWESTGGYGDSTLREVDLNSGKVLRSVSVDRRHFAEGMVKLPDGRILQLTWRGPTTLVYRADTLAQTEELKTPLTDGWGLTTDGRHLIVSDSSHTLTWLDVSTLQHVRSVTVHDGDANVKWMNELEWVGGEVWGNIWQTECIARVRPDDGRVVGWILFHGLKRRAEQALERSRRGMDVMNGIAFDEATGRLFVTGKLWPRVYEVEIVRAPLQDGAALAAARQACIIPPHVDIG